MPVSVRVIHYECRCLPVKTYTPMPPLVKMAHYIMQLLLISWLKCGICSFKHPQESWPNSSAHQDHKIKLKVQNTITQAAHCIEANRFILLQVPLLDLELFQLPTIVVEVSNKRFTPKFYTVAEFLPNKDYVSNLYWSCKVVTCILVQDQAKILSPNPVQMQSLFPLGIANKWNHIFHSS